MPVMTEQERIAALFDTQEQPGSDTFDVAGDAGAEEDSSAPVISEASAQQEPLDAEQARIAALFDEQEQGGPGLPDVTQVRVPGTSDFVDIESDVMLRANKDIGAKRKARIGLGGYLEGLGDVLEAPFSIVAGAIDEATALLGRDTSKSGAYPVQKIVNDIIRFDETAEMLYPKSQRQRITAADYAIDAAARGMGSAGVITQPTIALGNRTLTPKLNAAGEAEALTAGQHASIGAGKTLRTPTEATFRRQGTNKAGRETTTPLMKERVAADPRAAMGADVLFSTTSGIGAGTGAAIASDQSPEGREQGANLGELAGLAGGFGVPTLKAIATKGPSGFIARKLWRKTEPVRDTVVSLFDREAFDGMTTLEKMKPTNWRAMVNTRTIERTGRKDVLEHVHRLVRTPEVQENIANRLRAVNSVNDRLASAGITNLDGTPVVYKPGLGALIGTEESIAFQQMTDYHNYDYALRTQHQNHKALTEITKLFSKDPLYKYGDELADMFEMMARDTDSMLGNMESKMDDVAVSLIDQSFLNAGTPTKEGEILRRHYLNMQDVYGKLTDDMYKLVKLPNTIKFKANALAERMAELGKPNRADSVVGSRIPTLETLFPNALKDSFNEKTGNYIMDYDTLDSFRKRISSDIRELQASSPKSTYMRTLQELERGIDDVLDAGIDQLPQEFSHVKAARYAARSFFKKEVVPRFRQGALGDVDAVNVDMTMKISDDSLMGTFFERGTRTEGARSFKKLFANIDNVDDPNFDVGDLQILAKEAKEANESMFRYALGTLDDMFTQSGATGLANPQKVLDRWRAKYTGALGEFPEIAKRTENLDDVFQAIAHEAHQMKMQRQHLSNNIISKFMGTNPKKVVKEFLTDRRSAQRILDQIDSIYNKDAGKILEIKEALRVVITNNILDAGMDTVSRKFKYNDVARMLEESKDTLPLLLGQEDIRKLAEFNTALAVLADQPALNQQANLNDLQIALNKAGVSPASILSRYYSASLGKVGPLYLGVDAATRFLTKKAEVHFQDLYRELMYNPQTLTDLNDMLRVASQKGDVNYKVAETSRKQFVHLLSKVGINVYNNEQLDDVNGREAALGTSENRDETVWDYDPIKKEVTRGVVSELSSPGEFGQSENRVSFAGASDVEFNRESAELGDVEFASDVAAFSSMDPAITAFLDPSKVMSLGLGVSDRALQGLRTNSWYLKGAFAGDAMRPEDKKELARLVGIKNDKEFWAAHEESPLSNEVAQMETLIPLIRANAKATGKSPEQVASDITMLMPDASGVAQSGKGRETSTLTKAVVSHETLHRAHSILRQIDTENLVAQNAELGDTPLDDELRAVNDDIIRVFKAYSSSIGARGEEEDVRVAEAILALESNNKVWQESIEHMSKGSGVRMMGGARKPFLQAAQEAMDKMKEVDDYNADAWLTKPTPYGYRTLAMIRFLGVKLTDKYALLELRKEQEAPVEPQGNMEAGGFNDILRSSTL